ncbi:AAA family ATPase [mine drainage metagenome]|uniref:AAA family ATPase n=1 Tax=mine drainage metagenome TaxID=410659 RepID=T1CD60_9ZZZZ
MAITNHERIGKALELLKIGLGPFVEREFKAKYGDNWAFEVKDLLSETRLGAGKGDLPNDVAALLVVMDRRWGEVFRQILGKSERSLVNEILAVRNGWAHQQTFSGDDAYRALDSAGRLLSAISAPQSDEIEKMKTELLRVRFDEQARSEKRKTAGSAIESGGGTGLKPWREVVIPHEDVASGRYQQAEFAADLWQVHLGEGTPEYRDPVEFFRRTYLTESLKMKWTPLSRQKYDEFMHPRPLIQVRSCASLKSCDRSRFLNNYRDSHLSDRAPRQSPRSSLCAESHSGRGMHRLRD